MQEEEKSWEEQLDAHQEQLEKEMQEARRMVFRLQVSPGDDTLKKPNHCIFNMSTLTEGTEAAGVPERGNSSSIKAASSGFNDIKKRIYYRYISATTASQAQKKIHKRRPVYFRPPAADAEAAVLEFWETREAAARSRGERTSTIDTGSRRTSTSDTGSRRTTHCFLLFSLFWTLVT